MTATVSTLPPAAKRARHAAKPVTGDIGAMWRHAAAHGYVRELRELHRPRPLRVLAAAAADWALIALAAFATLHFGWPAVPIALLVIGNRQRALGNLLHDAAHVGMAGRHRHADVLANLLFCFPLGVSLAIYRDEHGRHHAFLGDPARDPDYIHDESRLPGGWPGTWRDQLVAPARIRASILGDLGRMDAASLAGVICWWALLLLAIALVGGLSGACCFLALWIAAKASVFHAITSFREISDHVGLDPQSLVGFSRSHPVGGLSGQFLHPHHNGYHLLHHLAPGMPFHALPAGHVLLMRWPPYAAGEHCDAYFLGESSAVRSWVRRFTSPAGRP